MCSKILIISTFTVDVTGTWSKGLFIQNVCEGMVELKQTKVIYTEHESERETRL